MHNACCIMQILNCAQELQEIVARKPLIKATFFIPDLNEGKEISLLNEFKDNEKHLDSFSTWFDNDLSLAIILKKFNNVGVVHCLYQVDLILQYFFECGEIDPLDLVPLNNFDCVKPVVLQRLSEFHSIEHIFKC